MKSGFDISRVLICILMAGGVVSCDTGNNIEDPDMNYFIKYYGGAGSQFGVDMELLADGTMMLLGNSSSSPTASFGSNIYLVHVDAQGEVLSDTTISAGEVGAEDIVARDLEPTNDGNFVILADYRNTATDPTRVALLKVSVDGVLLGRAVNIGTAGNESSRSVTPLDDGGFIISGTTDSTSTFNTGNPDQDLGNFFNYRLDRNLDLFSTTDWAPIFPKYNGKLDIAVKAIQKPGEFYVFGYSNNNLSDNNPDNRLGLFYFLRDSLGGESKPVFPGNAPNTDTEIQYVHIAAPELGGGFFVVGTSRDNPETSGIFVAKLPADLAFLPSDASMLYKTLPIQRNLRGVSAASSLTGSFGYLVLGNEIRSRASNIWLSKIDQSGAILWSSTFGSEAEDDTGAAVRELPDGKILILGTMGLADNQSKIALIKVNAGGQLLK